MQGDRAQTVSGIRAAGTKVALFLIVFAALGFLLPSSITLYYLVRQDLPLLAVMSVVWLGSFWQLTPRSNPITLSGPAVAGIAILTCALGYAGHYWLLHGYALTRDEQMALFDAQIFAGGRLTWPLPPMWRHDAPALNTMFIAQIGNPAGWVSGYLPGNAMLRALVGKIADPALTGAALSGIGVAMTWLCARRLWPEDREPVAVACLLVALSGQVQITGMTAYAMPAHLAFNMVWLWLFLRGRLSTDIAALAVGFIATGLHQPVFHPLFVAPWLAMLLWQRDWRRLAIYSLPYLAFGLFWLAWPQWQLAAVAGPASAIAAGEGDLWARISALLGVDANRLALMGANLVRFATWQPVVLLPLALLGCHVARRDARAAALAGGLVLTGLAMVVLMALQGHGFGYRYFHGLIGSLALLAAFGWRTLGDSLPWARTVLLRSLVLGTILMVPLQWWFGSSFYGAYAVIDQRIASSKADFVLIGEQDAPYSADLVLNRPDLSNRPVRLLAEYAPDSAALARLICRPGVTVAIPADGFYRAIDTMLGTQETTKAGERARRVTPALQAAGCRVIALD